MISAPALFLFFLFFSACSLIHQEQPNGAPVLQASTADTTRVHRGGRVLLEVRASDEDDDPLYYQWNALGAGDFTDMTCVDSFGPGQRCASIGWIAPETIGSNSELFLISVAIRDRHCDIILADADRQLCEEEAGKTAETFLIEVVQTPPSLTTSPDTTIAFRESTIALDAFGVDQDNDVLEYRWEQTGGEPLDFRAERVDGGHSRLSFTPIFPGDYRFEVEATDGSDAAAGEIQVRLIVDPEPPADDDAMVSLILTQDDGSVATYEMDVYEYPNQKGAIPLLVDSFFEAERLCAERDKRLCTSVEWIGACQGEEESLYSSSDDPSDPAFPDSFGLRFCNAPGSAVAGDDPLFEDLAPAGSFFNCSSSTGVYDLTGNAREWVQDINNSLERSGRYNTSSVQESAPCTSFINPLPTVPPDAQIGDSAYDGYRATDLGFRCCR